MANDDEGLLKKAAKALGKAAGSVAATVGAGGEQEEKGRAAAPAKKAGKLPKKNMSRLPRKAKKMAQKKQAARSA